MNETKGPKELQDLAKTLEVELDPEATASTAPVDVGPKQVMVNPVLSKEAPVVVPPAAPQKAEDEISLDDLLAATPEKIVVPADTAIPPNTNQDSVTVVVTPLEGNSAEPASPAPDSTPPAQSKKISGATSIPARTYDWTSKGGFYFVKIVRGAGKLAISQSQQAGLWIIELGKKVARVRSWSIRDKMILLCLMIVSLLILAVLLKDQLRSKKKVADIISEADSVEVLEEGAEEVQFLGGEPGFEDVVLLRKVVVNIKRSENSGTTPMVAYELYVQGSNQDVAVEVKERERDLRDSAARVAEEFTYDQLSSAEGKNRFKVVLRKELNSKLERGRIVGLYFKTFIIKP